MKFADRLITILITATLTSAAWIVFGESLFREAAPQESEVETETVADAGSDRPPATLPAEEDARQDDAIEKNAQTRAQSLDLQDASDLPEAASDQLIIPVMGVSADDLTDNFTDARAGGERVHEAIDIMAEKGTSVISAAPGTIERLFRSEAGGNTIYVRSEDGRTIYYYAHMEEYAPGLREGQRIRRGQRLGSVGSSGNADPSAPHLHFAIFRTTANAKWWEPGNAIDPYPLLKNLGNP